MKKIIIKLITLVIAFVAGILCTSYFYNNLPDLRNDYVNLMALWQKMWLKTYKAFGWEVINGRLGFVIARLDYASERLSDYLCGKIETIEELDEPIVVSHNPENRKYADLVTGSKYL